MQKDDEERDVFKIAKRIVKINQDVMGEQCIRNDGVLAVNDEDNKIVWNIYYEKLLDTELAWYRNSLRHADLPSDVPRLIDKGKLKESINEIKNGEAAETSGLMSEMVKKAGEAGVDIITDLVNQIIELKYKQL